MKQLIESTAFLFIGLLFCHISHATTWTTHSYGFFSNGSTWSAGVVPPYSSADTFFIQHPVAIDTTITLFPGAVFHIDSTGGICGHENMIFQSNSKLYVYGILDLDTLFVPGGQVYGYPPGNITLTQAGIISNGGSMSITCAMAVGPWFICHQPEYGFLTSSPEAGPTPQFKTYPNPASRKLNIESHSVVGLVTITNLKGIQVAALWIENNEVPLDQLPDGLYLFEFYDKEKAGIAFQKIMVLK